MRIYGECSLSPTISSGLECLDEPKIVTFSRAFHSGGSIGYTTKSGGMSNELNNIVALNTDGVREGHLAFVQRRYGAKTSWRIIPRIISGEYP